ncbi:PHD finger protein 21A-like [Pectinophora gossypiella]|nr:PHD finger protein 21A-like [Pectinophora gossypiella]
MEVSNKIKEEIRKTQSDLKNAIRVHQIWVARLQDDESNFHLKTKVKEAEKEIISIGQTQKLVVERLRRELELYQQRLKARNKQINIENDNRYVAQQLRDHQLQYCSRSRSVSLLKPSVLSEIHIKAENNNEDLKENISDSDNESKSHEKENSNHSEMDEKDKYQRNYSQLPTTVHDSRSNFANALNKVKESLIGVKMQQQASEWNEQRSDSDCSGIQLSPTPSPPPLPKPGELVSQETFLRLIGLVTHSQKEILEKKRSERRKRSTTSTNRTDFLYGNYDMMPKRKKLNQFPYLQTHNDPPQTRSAKLRKQQNQNKSSREGSPSGSSSENKGSGWSNGKPAWASSLPAGLSVEPVYPPSKKVCHGCGRNDVPSLLVWCSACGVCVHTGCSAEGRCPAPACRAPLPDPAACAAPHVPDTQLYRDKLAERKRLQEKNIELCVELRKLEARAASLKENLDEHNAEKRQLLAAQIKTQRNLQKLLDFISQFKETSISMRSSSASDTGSDISKSNEE